MISTAYTGASGRVFSAHAGELHALVRDSAGLLAQRWSQTFSSVLIAGSGIHASLGSWTKVDSLPLASLTEFGESSVPGHQSAVSWYRAGSRNVLVFEGRRHVYEGVLLQDVVKPVVLANLLGIEHCILTNAAGSLSPLYEAGDVMLAHELVNSSARAVVVRGAERTRMIDDAWLQRVRSAIENSAPHLSACVHTGVYVSVAGPSYETRAEVRMYRAMADVIGMSTVHEAQCAVGLGMKVAAVSVVSNTLDEAPSKKLTHEDVLRVAANSADRLQQVLQLVVDTVEHKVKYKEE